MCLVIFYVMCLVILCNYSNMLIDTKKDLIPHLNGGDVLKSGSTQITFCKVRSGLNM